MCFWPKVACYVGKALHFLKLNENEKWSHGSIVGYNMRKHTMVEESMVNQCVCSIYCWCACIVNLYGYKIRDFFNKLRIKTFSVFSFLFAREPDVIQHPLLPYSLLRFFSRGIQRRMEVPSDVQQLEPHPLASPWSGANQQDEAEDRQAGDSDEASTDELSQDVQPADQTADNKVSRIHPLLHMCSCCASLPGCVWMSSDDWRDLIDMSWTSLFTFYLCLLPLHVFALLDVGCWRKPSVWSVQRVWLCVLAERRSETVYLCSGASSALKGRRCFVERIAFVTDCNAIFKTFHGSGWCTDPSAPSASQSTVPVVFHPSQGCHSKISLAEVRTFYCQPARDVIPSAHTHAHTQKRVFQKTQSWWKPLRLVLEDLHNIKWLGDLLSASRNDE